MNKNYPKGRKWPAKLPHDYKPAQRTCLGLECGKLFNSPGPAVRFCPKCRARSDDAKRNLSRRQSQRMRDTRGQ